NKEGLAGRFKIVGQVGLGIIIACTMYFHPEVVVRETVTNPVPGAQVEAHVLEGTGQKYYTKDVKSTKTNIPFYKNNEFDYAKVLNIFGLNSSALTFVVFLIVVVIIVTAVSNGANITDGIDGLAT